MKLRSFRPLRAFATVLAGTVLLTGAACPADKIVAPEQSDPAGNYTLTLIDQGGASCAPATNAAGCTIQETGSSTVVVKSGAMTLQQNGTFTLTAAGTRDGANASLAGVTGTWAQANGVVSFTVPGLPLAIPAASSNGGSQLTFVVPGQAFGSARATLTVAFTKQP
jgi:hypothetical protein